MLISIVDILCKIPALYHGRNKLCVFLLWYSASILHRASTIVYKKARQYATDLQDTKLLAKLAMQALDTYYHK